ncbi:hypothetical protein E4U55_007902 [Claviceps digitariae]|nr:hypothetical protein E4U55_007902 [Claviceps digitariae]
MAAFFAPALRVSRHVSSYSQSFSFRYACRGTRLFSQTPKPHGRIRDLPTDLVEDETGMLLRSRADGIPPEKRISKLWLRDNCSCEKCVNQATLQRNFNTFDIPIDIASTSIRNHEKGVDVTWSDSHESTYTWTWFLSVLHQSKNQQLRGIHDPRLWNSAVVVKNPPKVPYDSVMDKDDIKGMADLTNKICEDGFCFVTDSPVTPEATEKLLKAIGPIRNTHYGGFYDFVPDLAKADTAYTNLALAAHTDTTYFTEPAGLQAFHLLSHTPPPNKTDEDEASLLGGQSLLVDGFYAAHRLRNEFPSAYEVLRTVRVPWHASGNQDVAISPHRASPVIDACNRRINLIRWNNDDRGAIPLHVENIDEWYDAARKWNMILRRPENEYWFQLEPGQILIFDNWRILHGRSAFEGLRRMCGGYINRDDFISRWQLSNFPRDQVIMANMHGR